MLAYLGEPAAGRGQFVRLFPSPYARFRRFWWRNAAHRHSFQQTGVYRQTVSVAAQFHVITGPICLLSRSSMRGNGGDAAAAVGVQYHVAELCIILDLCLIIPVRAIFVGAVRVVSRHTGSALIAPAI